MITKHETKDLIFKIRTGVKKRNSSTAECNLIFKQHTQGVDRYTWGKGEQRKYGDAAGEMGETKEIIHPFHPSIRNPSIEKNNINSP